MRLIFETIAPDADSFVRLPGAFRREEVAHVVLPEADIVLTPAGRAQDGERLFAVHIEMEWTCGGAT